MAVMCKDYKPRDSKARQNCPNCYEWLSVKCLKHLELVKEYETTKKFKMLDRMMRDNRGVVLE